MKKISSIKNRNLLNNPLIQLPLISNSLLVIIYKFLSNLTMISIAQCINLFIVSLSIVQMHQSCFQLFYDFQSFLRQIIFFKRIFLQVIQLNISPIFINLKVYSILLVNNKVNLVLKPT